PTFLVELSRVLANPGNSQVARVAAGLQIKNSLTSKDPDIKAQYQQRWLAIDANARREVKNYDPEQLQDKSNEILTAIIQGMRKEEPSNNVKLAATNALLNSLEFTKANFDKESERHFIMQVVCEATQCPDTRAAEQGRPPEHTSKFYAKGALQYLVPILTQTLTKQAMPTLIELMKDPSVVVRDTAAWTVGRIYNSFCSRPDGHQNNLRSSAYEALMEIVKNSAKDCYPAVQKTTLVIMERLQQVLQMESHIQSTSDRIQFNDLQSLLCATLQVSSGSWL
ncbi:UNVERIFIED_CONTAM: hypothetical protein H355_014755, partial [Colinus virginianus]